MSVRTWFDSLKFQRSRLPVYQLRGGKRHRRPASRRLSIETLEARSMMAAMVSIGNVVVLEGNDGTQNAAVTVSVSEPHSNAVTIGYRTANGTALAGSDFNAVSGQLTFKKNEMSKTILVSIIGDRGTESHETFYINLQSSKGGAKIANGTGVVTIMDNEPRISISDVQASEPNSGTTPFDFTVSLSAPYDMPVTVNYSTTDGSATAGTDYTATSGSVVIAPGDTTTTIPVLVSGNQTPEANKSFLVNVSTPNSYAEISKGVGVGTIIDNEPRISIAGAYNYYGESSFTFTVSLSATYNQVVTVNFATADGTAIAGVDYVATSGTLTFAPDETTKTITVTSLNPTAVDISFSVHLSGVSANALITNEWATGYSYYGYYDYYYDPGYYYGDYYYDYYYYW